MKITKIFLILLILSSMGIMKISAQSANPFFEKWDTPFGVPPFDKIKPEHYTEAIKEGINRHNVEIDLIVKSTKIPTFDNVIGELEFSGDLLNKVQMVFSNQQSANTNKDIQKVAKEITPLLSKHNDDLFMNAGLFKKIKIIYDKKGTLGLNNEQMKVLNDTYRNFVKSGANLNAKDQAKLRKINNELSNLQLKFGENLLAETNGFQLIIDKLEDLKGLPDNLIKAGEETAKELKMAGKWVYTLHNPSLMPFLTYSANRPLREKIWTAYSNRGNNKNKFNNNEIITKITNLRYERSKVLGYKNYAAYALDEAMAKTPESVFELLNKLWTPAINKAKEEANELQAMIDKEGGNFKLAPWDWRYYAEKLRKEKYDLDEEAIKPYLEMESVKNALFMVTGKLYGIKFVEIKDIPKPHPDATAYEVQNSDGSHIGVIYMDFYPRESKRGGAWMSNYRNQYRKYGIEVSPIVTIVGNFTKPTGNTPSLLTLDEASTLFHEAGHALHGLLSKCTYPSVSGTSVARDFVELPSQILENWVADAEVMKLFAKNYKTGEVIPDDLIQKIQNSSKFNQGFATTEYLAASLLDMTFHSKQDNKKFDTQKFEKETLDKIGLIPEIISRYRSTYFNHIWGGGYSAGYYSYIWAEILDADAFAQFKKNGIFDKKTADAFRKNILERGGTDDPMNLYKGFRGAEPSIDALLERRGLNDTKAGVKGN